jgi:hypothetical protein
VLANAEGREIKTTESDWKTLQVESWHDSMALTIIFAPLRARKSEGLFVKKRNVAMADRLA